MITEADFYAIAKARPEMMRAFYKAVDAITEVRKEVATNQSGLWATARLKKKEFTATFLLKQFASGFLFNGQPLSEEDKKLVHHWIIGAANFHMLPEEEKNGQLLRNARDIEEEELLLGGRTSGIITALAPTGLSTRFSRAGFVYVVSTAHVKDFGGFYQTAILKYSSTDWEAGHLADRQFVYRIEVLSQLRSVQEHIDTVRMAVSKNEDAWEGTKAYQDDVINAHGRRNDCPQEMSWTDKRISDIVSAANINYTLRPDTTKEADLAAAKARMEMNYAIASHPKFAGNPIVSAALANAKANDAAFRKAADQGHAEAQAALGSMYAHGQGVPPSLAEFEVLVGEVFRHLPREFRDRCVDLVIQVDDFPSEEVVKEMQAESKFDLLGFFQGVGLPFRSTSAPMQTPNRIWLYRRPIIDYWAEHDETLGAIVKYVLVHEIVVHHFGVSNADMEDTVALDSAYAEDKGNQTPQRLITSEDEKNYGTDLIDLAKRAAMEVKDLELIAFCQEYLAQCAAIGGDIDRAPFIPPFTKLITPEQEQAYGNELIDVAKRAAREAMDPELNALRQELLSQFTALGAKNSARGTPSMPPAKLITPEDEQNYGNELIDLFKRAAREDAVLGVNKIKQQLLSQFAEFQSDIARGIISRPDYRPAPHEGDTPDVSVLNNFDFGKFKLDEKLDDLTGLVEFSPAKYAVMVRRFKGEKNYDAPPVNFLGRPWQSMISTVHGQICKVAIDICLSNEREATPIATEALQYCKERLGSPTEQKTGLFVWDTKDGNVVLQTTEGAEGFLIAIYLTSSAIRKFELL
jgi:predicted Zn-dependent protease with MMP-like domain